MHHDVQRMCSKIVIWNGVALPCDNNNRPWKGRNIIRNSHWRTKPINNHSIADRIYLIIATDSGSSFSFFFLLLSLAILFYIWTKHKIFYAKYLQSILFFAVFLFLIAFCTLHMFAMRAGISSSFLFCSFHSCVTIYKHVSIVFIVRYSCNAQMHTHTHMCVVTQNELYRKTKEESNLLFALFYKLIRQ